MVLLLSIGLLGWWYVVVPLQVIVAGRSLPAAAGGLAVSLTALAVAIALVQAARAVVEWHPEQFGEIGLVLPSGHSALVVVAVTTVATLVWPRWSPGRIAAAAVLILAVAGVMTTLGGHTVRGCAGRTGAGRRFHPCRRGRGAVPPVSPCGSGLIVSNSATGPAWPAR